MFTLGPIILWLLCLEPLVTTLACSVTVSSTTLYNYATQRPTATPMTTNCLAGVCESTGCVSSTKMISYFVCEDHCLASSTSTSTFTSYLPDVTTTVECGPKYHNKRDSLFSVELKDSSCAPGPTLVKDCHLTCKKCRKYPHSTVVTRSVTRTSTVLASCTSTQRPTISTSSGTITLSQVYTK